MVIAAKSKGWLPHRLRFSGCSGYTCVAKGVDMFQAWQVQGKATDLVVTKVFKGFSKSPSSQTDV